MPISITDNGTNNTVEMHPDQILYGQGTIKLSGSGNVIIIEKPIVYGELRIDVANGAHVHIGANCILSRLYVNSPRGARLTIGTGTAFNGASVFHMEEDRGVTVGNECLIAPDVRVWPSDMHSVIDVETRSRVNPPRDIVIGNRVWIGFNALVLKGSKIGDGSILGAGSVLAGEVPPDCAAAGNPARIIRQGVTWDARLLELTPVG